MNFILTNKFFILLLCFFVLFGCTSKNVYKKLKPKNYTVLTAESLDENNITLNSKSKKILNIDKKITLKKFNNSKPDSSNIIIEKGKIFAIKNNELLEFDQNTAELISTKIISIQNINEDTITSFKNIDNYFLIAFKSGLIIKINKQGDIIWKFHSYKILNTEFKIFEDQLILLFIDEIVSINLDDGSEIWSEKYNDLPIYQSNGGQLVNFLNLLYFILPNNKVGSFDLNLGKVHNSKFDEIPLISSINNINDKIHIFDNRLFYLDEGKYLYTFDIFINDFILFKYTINLASSNFFFNNSLILKEGNSLKAININNGKTFWVIDNKKINKKSKIIFIRNILDNIKIYLNNGDVLTINNKELIEIYNIGINKIRNINFDEKNIIVNTENGKTIIF